MVADGLIAKTYRQSLRAWTGPERLLESNAIAELTTVPFLDEFEEDYQAVRRCIAKRRWQDIRKAYKYDKWEDDIVWSLLIGPNDARYVVESLSPFEFSLTEEVRDVWRIGAQDERELRMHELVFYDLKATELGDWGRWLGRLCGRIRRKPG